MSVFTEKIIIEMMANLTPVRIATAPKREKIQTGANFAGTFL